MITIHNLGFPRIGKQRELKFLLEQYWAGEIDQQYIEQESRQLRQRYWQDQAEAGLDLIPVNDFSLYDQVLDMSALLGVIPERFGQVENNLDLDTYFRMARGQAPRGVPVAACEMTKWFDTNYHYIVPEFSPKQSFQITSQKLFDEIDEAQAEGHSVKPVLIGPLTYLWLGKSKEAEFDNLDLLESLLPVYTEILNRLLEKNIDWIQFDEPVLGLDLNDKWKQAFQQAYQHLAKSPVRILLANYFTALDEHLSLAVSLPVAGLHLDITQGTGQLDAALAQWPEDKILSLGVIDGRNIWATDLDKILTLLEPVCERLQDRLWLAPSCSLLHCPYDLEQEDRLDDEMKGWFAFSLQKLDELRVLRRGLKQGRRSVSRQLRESMAVQSSRKQSKRITRLEVQARLSQVDDAMLHRQSGFAERIREQQQILDLPLYPTTTIGSFPQTNAIRQQRRRFKNNELSQSEYETDLKKEIENAIREQEALGLDVLVHGEAERNDMVEYFGEQLDGFAFTGHGWVQSYGSRCVKPPIIYGDVARHQAMTISWSRYAQSLTDKPVKGMLTGPVTILKWSFPRDDQSLATSCKQIALALRDEVLELEQAGIKVIQIDEPALREGLPLKQSARQHYLDWAVNAFRLASCGVKDETQIHTHMCYAEFNDIIEAIAKLDADVITLETSRSDMKLLDAFRDFKYPNQIGPGVYDIHSPRIIEKDAMVSLLKKARENIAAEQLWVNPDCGLKTRRWDEVKACLKNMVEAAKSLRQQERASRAA